VFRGSSGQRIAAAADGRRGLLLERGEAMSYLTGLLAGVRSGSDGQLVLVGGEAGVGKTSLLRSFCEAQDESVRIAWGACEPLRTPRPLGPLSDVADACGGELAALVAAGARAHEVVSGLLRELRRRGPTVLVLEDVHWADEATLDVLVLIAARLAPVPALVFATYRDDEVDRAAEFRAVLGELARRPGRIKLEPLSPAGVWDLAEPYGVDGEELYRRTGGNPFFVTEALAAGGERIPATVRDAVRAREARLSEPARRLLEAVAVIPGQVDLHLLDALAGELVDRLEECLTSGMLTAGATDVAFRHELARLAIEEAIAPNRRIALHAAALAALARRGGDRPEYARLAYHAEAAGDAEGVLRWAPAAAERAASSGAHRESAAQYACALRFSGDLPLERRAELLQRRADECYLTDQFAEAIEAQEGALDIRRALGDLRGEGDALRSLARLLRFVGRTRDGHAAARQAVEMLERLPPGHELAIAYSTVSHLWFAVEDDAGTLEWGARALELAGRLDDTEALVYALTNIGTVESLAGEYAGREKLEQALELAQEADLEEAAGRVFVHLVLWPSPHRRLPADEMYVEDGLRYCEERGLDTWRLFLLASRARLELDDCRWDRAAESAGLVLRDPRSAQVPRGWALVTLGLLAARRGEAGGAAPLAEAHALAQAAGELQRIGPVAAARAEVAWLAGDEAGVAEATDAALALALARGWPWVVGELACWRRRAGMHDELPDGAAAEPYRLAIAGECERAAALLRQGGRSYEAALSLADSHDPLVVRQSIDELTRLGARTAAAIVARGLRRRGVSSIPRGPRRRTRENPAGLTPRELEVLVLLVEGLRNAQIAQRLVVSGKTVDHHVSAVLRKLGVHSRADAAAEALRLGLTTAGPQSAGTPN
jgi:DNA-binding CsgD family transcriptional regulator